MARARKSRETMSGLSASNSGSSASSTSQSTASGLGFAAFASRPWGFASVASASSSSAGFGASTAVSDSDAAKAVRKAAKNQRKYAKQKLRKQQNNAAAASVSTTSSSTQRVINDDHDHPSEDIAQDNDKADVDVVVEDADDDPSKDIAQDNDKVDVDDDDDDDPSKDIAQDDVTVDLDDDEITRVLDMVKQVLNTHTDLEGQVARIREAVKAKNDALPALLKEEISNITKEMVQEITVKDDNFSIMLDEMRGVNQLEKSVNSKLEANVVKGIKEQFQTLVREALQSYMQASVVPALEKSCEALFEKGLLKQATTGQQHIDALHSQLTHDFREAINSASSATKTLRAELVDGNRKVAALAVGRGKPGAEDLLVRQVTSGIPEKVEVTPMKELQKLVDDGKYDEAFSIALKEGDVDLVTRLCAQVDLHSLLLQQHLPLSQGVLLSLFQQLASDINNDMLRKVVWMTHVASLLDPRGRTSAIQAAPFLSEVYEHLFKLSQDILPTVSNK